MSKKKVICDTNIWYDVSFNKLALNKNEFYYCATLTNIIDFISSDKINGTNNERQALRNAILTMDNQADEIIWHDPTTEARRLLYNIEISEKEIRESKANYYELLKYAKNQVNDIYGPGLDSLILTKKGFQELTLSFKKQLDQKFGKLNKYGEAEKDFVRRHIVNYLHENFKNMNGFNTDPSRLKLNNISLATNLFSSLSSAIRIILLFNPSGEINIFVLIFMASFSD